MGKQHCFPRLVSWLHICKRHLSGSAVQSRGLVCFNLFWLVVVYRLFIFQQYPKGKRKSAFIHGSEDLLPADFISCRFDRVFRHGQQITNKAAETGQVIVIACRSLVKAKTAIDSIISLQPDTELVSKRYSTCK